MKERKSANGIEGGGERVRGRGQSDWEIGEGDIWTKTRRGEGASYAKSLGESIAGKGESLMQEGAWCVPITERRPRGWTGGRWGWGVSER